MQTYLNFPPLIITCYRINFSFALQLDIRFVFQNHQWVRCWSKQNVFTCLYILKCLLVCDSQASINEAAFSSLHLNTQAWLDLKNAKMKGLRTIHRHHCRGPSSWFRRDGVDFWLVHGTLLIVCYFPISRPHDHTLPLLSHASLIFYFVFTYQYTFISQQITSHFTKCQHALLSPSSMLFLTDLHGLLVQGSPHYE